MFYSHAILTSREHGVATVWLVATLGSKSSLKTVTRKKILDVDVLKACDTIQNPEAPMALRLQGNLLFGVARVYDQQCGYVLADTQAVRDKVRGISMVIKEMALDPEAGRARPEQLNLPDDPAFMPELDLSFDLPSFTVPFKASDGSSLMSPRSLLSSRSSQQAGEEKEEEEEEEEEVGKPALDLPSGDILPGSDMDGFGPGAFLGVSSVGRTPGPSILEAETGIVDVGWEFDEHGNILETAQAPKPPTPVPAAEGISQPRVRRGSATSARVHGEHAEGVRPSQQARGGGELDDGMLAMGDDEHDLSAVQPFSPRQSTATIEQVQHPIPTSSAPPAEETSSTAVSAPQRRARTVKAVELDERTGLTNSELRQWNEGYLENMKEAADAKHPYKLAHQARRNAEHWVLGQGLGGVGSGLGQDQASGPLQLFSGASLLEAITGRTLSSAGTKHARSASTTSATEEERRVRIRSEKGDQIGRGAVEQDLTLGPQDDGLFAGADEMDIEVGRIGAEDLPEGRSSHMPWDIFSASRKGSIHPLGSAAAGMKSSAGGHGVGIELGPPPALSRRGSRLTTASPLQGRGPPLPLSQRISILSTPNRGGLETSGALGEDDEMAGLELPELGDESVGFQLSSPAANLDTKTAAQSKWVAAALDSESRNFLDFLDVQIQAQVPLTAGGEEEMEGNPTRTALFEGLLPPREHSRIVAAQAFLHVLTLASKSLITVKQEGGFGDIELTVAVEA